MQINLYLCTLFWMNMTLLCIETSTSVCSAAIVINGQPVAARISRSGGNHAQLLPCFVDELLAQAKEQQWTLDGVALSEGPGSYTGLRIGASLAKGICYGLSIPLLPLPTTQVLAASYISQSTIHHPTIGDSRTIHHPPSTIHHPQSTILCPMIDARRMEVYTALYTPELGQIGAVEAKIVDSASWQAELDEHEVYFFGDGAMKCASTVVSEHAHFVPDIVPEAQYMGGIAEALPRQAYVEGKALAYFNPLYVKEFVPAPSHVKGLI